MHSGTALLALIRQPLESVRPIISDEYYSGRVLRELLAAAGEMDLALPFATMDQWIHRRIREPCSRHRYDFGTCSAL